MFKLVILKAYYCKVNAFKSYYTIITERFVMNRNWKLFMSRGQNL